jgi:hypothetical protein
VGVPHRRKQLGLEPALAVRVAGGAEAVGAGRREQHQAGCYHDGDRATQDGISPTRAATNARSPDPNVFRYS